ncbi:GatB/YqeY domain-containing protein [Fulvivirga lutimaris]|uniref:GatB/YqeY domain-containing protein n=1 Tax=Fulvivirga lutimaris TaxID=1819566 RepID=UPI0012BB69F4|nr:GatB/YqeY domain-containing protein [Fulvivirga lutimaris]MTI41292.1 GatB/YqeY domain-containing protein [Fulvivirga lutimaris]
MSLKQQIDGDIKQAMLQKKKEELTALRAIKSAILLAETEKGGGDGLDSDAEMKLLAKQAKQRKDSADIYAKEGREDLANKELFELEVISKYLPKQLSDEEIEETVKGIISKVGAAGPQDMGKVMGAATKEMSGKADGKKISEIVKKLLSN